MLIEADMHDTIMLLTTFEFLFLGVEVNEVVRCFCLSALTYRSFAHIFDFIDVEEAYRIRRAFFCTQHSSLREFYSIRADAAKQHAIRFVCASR